jgi:hypothetical protein
MLAADLKKADANLSAMQNFTEQLPEEDPVRKLRLKQITSLSSEAKSLNALFDAVQLKLDEVCAYFGENPSKLLISHPCRGYATREDF